MEKFKRPFRFLFLLLLVMSAPRMLAQQISISGTVSDPSGEPLIGVSVTVPGSKTGVATDIDGMYSIEADAKSTLRFSYVGYKTKEVSVNGKNTIDVVMEEDSEVLQEVVAPWTRRNLPLPSHISERKTSSP